VSEQNPGHRQSRLAEMRTMPIEQLRERVQLHQYGDRDHDLARDVLAEREAAAASELQARAIVRQEEANELVRRANALDEEANELTRAANAIASDAAESARAAAAAAVDTANSARVSAAEAAAANLLARKSEDTARASMIAAAMMVLVTIIGIWVVHRDASPSQTNAPRISGHGR